MIFSRTARASGYFFSCNSWSAFFASEATTSLTTSPLIIRSATVSTSFMALGSYLTAKLIVWGAYPTLSNSRVHIPVLRKLALHLPSLSVTGEG